MARVWTEAQRQHQRELIQRVKPWEKSTGPTSEEGKARSSHNAYLHGGYGAFVRVELRMLRRQVRDLHQSMRDCGCYLGLK